MNTRIDYSLCFVTDRGLMSTLTLESAVEQAAAGGCTLVQLRDKNASSLEFYHTAVNLKKITDSYNIPLIINDRADIALAAGAGGVHVGQDDLPCATVRRMLGKDRIIGVSVSTAKQAVRAQEDGADYIGVGAMFATRTKTDAEIVTIDTLKEIAAVSSIPIIAIGGINKKTIPYFRNVKIDGIAVVSAIIASKDIAGTARELKEFFLKRCHIAIFETELYNLSCGQPYD